LKKQSTKVGTNPKPIPKNIETLYPIDKHIPQDKETKETIINFFKYVIPLL